MTRNFMVFLACLVLNIAPGTAQEMKMTFNPTSYAPNSNLLDHEPKDMPVATFAGGCFWCVESEYRRIDGVVYTRVGYGGGEKPNPTYEQISTGKTGHREITRVWFDPQKISYRDIITFFLTQAHDPTQADGQGPNIGYQYTSAIYYHDESQKKIAEEIIAELTASGKFKSPIATKIEPFTNFYEAEDYHQEYYEKYQERTGDKHINIWIKEQKAKAKALLR